ncbi:zinc finger (C2H2 type) family protein isoform X2 [Wolffia australiana]
MEMHAPPSLIPGNYSMAAYAGRARKGVSPAARWLKTWVPQDLAASGGKAMVQKWVREDLLHAMNEKLEEPEQEELEPEPTTEILFLCSFEGCGKTFIDVAALRKHSHVHGEKQYICHYEGCGKKFLDSSKLKRHFLIHTGEKAYVCTYEGCGKAFSLDFNLRAHMRTHSQENYHVCPYEDCQKRFAHSYKLQGHIKTHHEKAGGLKPAAPEERITAPPKPSPTIFSDRPYVCPYDGCGKSYIHEYKLKLHLRREHPGHGLDEGKHEVTEKGSSGKSSKRSRSGSIGLKVQQQQQQALAVAPPVMILRKTPTLAPASSSKTAWAVDSKEVFDDSEETEEDGENAEEDAWRHPVSTMVDDEETEDED